MEVSIKFSCQWLADLGNAIKEASKWLGDESLYYNVWPHEVTTFWCGKYVLLCISLCYVFFIANYGFLFS